ncbi:YkgJ family cysteine cluster protein [Desulfolutivibrio sulfoxidireducens]|uniref:YkgJ family cysteine cluster protein n=1 Tax=Desulfolutivibrio sulfoxidireducens TaxID=2773299 RepID=UPI00159E6F93|nr:YkgJ family cysteine cluster protein [Desulfolutivibrio sulfoxidireducens]QLA17423.1 YkgJ family cysteine cluster protein [Desulfolutivibrio sulfoxidireducens]
MPLTFAPYFEKYQALLGEVDAVFAKVKAACPEAVTCGLGCSDCCHALFDVSLVEALYLNVVFNERFPKGPEREKILDLADRADRAHYKLKRKAFKAGEKGVSTEQILADLARERIRCPLLGDDDRCVLYDCRPVTCRLYGVPLEIGGKAHTCGKSGFVPGGAYPTVKVEMLQDRLFALSGELAAGIGSSYPLLADMLVPVSMALLTEYTPEYLGVPGEDDPASETPGVVDEASAAPVFARVENDCGSCGEAPGSAACASCGGSTSWVLGGPDDSRAKPDTSGKGD